ncbi:MAG: hypothetical protein HYU78_00505 [Rhodocyclales bacterium]|nr:hypothetical protein [Rhodocyclales bacterium]
MTTKTPDQIRREIRGELHRQRCLDNDHSISRLLDDASKLDAELKARGVLKYPTHWGKSPK